MVGRNPCVHPIYHQSWWTGIPMLFESVPSQSMFEIKIVYAGNSICYEWMGRWRTIDIKCSEY